MQQAWVLSFEASSSFHHLLLCLDWQQANPWIFMVTKTKDFTNMQSPGASFHQICFWITSTPLVREYMDNLGGPKSKQNLQGTLHPCRFGNCSLEFSLCSLARGNQHPPVRRGGWMVHDQQTVFCWAPIPYLIMVVSSRYPLS
jgi:hypothetical protein